MTWTLDSKQLGSHFDVVEAGISQLRGALETGSLTAVDLAASYLQRIGRYDCNGLCLNAVPLLNDGVFDEAAASDDRRASGATVGPLDGIPYSVKDSYKVRGMTVANGSPAFQKLQSNGDAFTVQKLREAGAVLMGKTNMPPMAAGGMQRGVFGRAESPYNLDYLAAAFVSGSSNGSAVSTAASFAAFGMGEETVSSGRSPASNNGLVAYTPSRGLISIRGNWPLYPTCDVVVPHTRTLDDMFEVLDIITAPDPISKGDFWRDQKFIPIQTSCPDRPTSFRMLSNESSPQPLSGVRVAVPSCYISDTQLLDSNPVYTSPETISLWNKARSDLESLGAEIFIVNEFPALQYYENPDSMPARIASMTTPLPSDWNSVERGPLIAHAWNNFLADNSDPNLPSLSAVDLDRIFPAFPPGDPQVAYGEPKNAIHYAKMMDYLNLDKLDSNAETTKVLDSFASSYPIKDLESACRTLEQLRQLLFEDWLRANNFSIVCFPAAGDVGRADADINHDSAKHAWTNGVRYSNGNRMLRHLGIPTVTVPMGLLEGKDMPMGLTFAGPAYSDTKLLRWAKAFEGVRHRRVHPPLTPSLKTEQTREPWHGFQLNGERPPKLIISKFEVRGCCCSTPHDQNQLSVELEGSLRILGENTAASKPAIKVWVNSFAVTPSSVIIIQPTSQDNKLGEASYNFVCKTTAVAVPAKKEPDARNRTEAVIARDQTLVMVLVRGVDETQREVSRPSGWFGLA